MGHCANRLLKPSSPILGCPVKTWLSSVTSTTKVSTIEAECDWLITIPVFLVEHWLFKWTGVWSERKHCPVWKMWRLSNVLRNWKWIFAARSPISFTRCIRKESPSSQEDVKPEVPYKTLQVNYWSVWILHFYALIFGPKELKFVAHRKIILEARDDHVFFTKVIPLLIMSNPQSNTQTRAVQTGYISPHRRPVSSIGGASDCSARGRGFKPRPDQHWQQHQRAEI